MKRPKKLCSAKKNSEKEFDDYIDTIDDGIDAINDGIDDGIDSIDGIGTRARTHTQMRVRAHTHSS